MIKLPKSDEGLPPEFIDNRTQFFHDYAALLMLWGHFEYGLEVAIAKLANLTPTDASIILGGLSFGNKPHILYSLLEKRGQPEVAAKVRDVINHVGRNALVHGIAGSDYDTNTFAFFRREVGDSYIVKHLTYTSDAFNVHFEQFRVLADKAMEALGLYSDDLEEFASEAGLLEPTPPSPQALLRREARDSKLAKKQRQREAQAGRRPLP